GVAQALGVTGGTGRGGDVGRTEAGCRTGGHGTGGRGEGPTRGRVDVGTGGRVLTGGRGEGARARLFLLRSPDGCRPPARRGTRRPPAGGGTRRPPAAPPPVRTVPVVPRPGLIRTADPRPPGAAPGRRCGRRSRRSC